MVGDISQQYIGKTKKREKETKKPEMYSWTPSALWNAVEPKYTTG
jgi:hypothetical protein